MPQGIAVVRAFATLARRGTLERVQLRFLS